MTKSVGKLITVVVQSIVSLIATIIAKLIFPDNWGQIITVDGQSTIIEGAANPPVLVSYSKNTFEAEDNPPLDTTQPSTIIEVDQ